MKESFRGGTMILFCLRQYLRSISQASDESIKQMSNPLNPDMAVERGADVYVHPTAIVDEPAMLGAGTKIWHFCHVMKNAEIGAGCNLGQNVFVASGVRLGRNCKVQNNVSLYEGVMLEDDVFCGPSMVFTNVKNPRSEIVRRGQYSITHVERGATLGANCTVVCGTRIGHHAFVAAGAVVTADVPPYAMMAGVPARRIGWAGRAGMRLQPLDGKARWFKCPETEEYYMEENTMTLKPAEAPAMETEEIAVPLLDLKAQHATIRGEVNAALSRVMESQYFIMGPEVKAFEQEAAAYAQAAHGVGCASGSDALLLALLALQLEPGDEVITTAYSFFATVSCIARLWLKPVFCDIDPVTFNIDANQLEKLITPRTRALLPVHLFGQCAEMGLIMDLARRHNLAVIEDAAQAIGASWRDRPAGSMGTFGCFSFFPSKNLGGAGDGGLVTTNDPELAARARSYQIQGAKKKYVYDKVVINSRLDALQAAVLRAKLPHLDQWSDGRARNAERYRRLFGEAGVSRPEGTSPEKGEVVLPRVVAGRHVYNQFCIRVHETRRDALQNWLKERKIGSEVYYPLGLHLQPCLQALGYQEGDCPQTELASRQSLALPIYTELTGTQQERVVAEIVKFLRQ